MIPNSIKALKANKVKTALIYLSLTISICAIFLITSISNGIISMYSNILKTDGDIIITQAKISDTFFSNVDTSIIPKIKSLEGVKKVSALIVGASPVEDLPIVAIYGTSKNRFSNYKLDFGSYAKNNNVIVGKSVYEQLKNKTEVMIANKKFKISGVYSSDIGFENGGIVMNLKDASEIFNKSSSMLLVNIDISKNIDKISSKIALLSNEIEVKSTQSFVDNYNQFKIINNSSYIISLIAFIMGLIGIGSIMSITVNERKDEFGIMKALGINSYKIISALILESLIIGFVSFISAFTLSNVVLYFIKNISSLQGYVNGEISLFLTLAVFIATLLMSILGAFIPSYSASKVDPITLIQRGN